MDHPHIAHVFDGGQTTAGRPYFVMELVRGIPITEFCDQNHLSVRDRLELFTSVCQAVQHAHLKGIIHRDLKPSNILVTLHDGSPVAKVIDFGIAKAMGQQLTDKTLFTNFVQMVGTPLYMSPEQAEMTGLDIDTRTDIYALGVLLYELLTGTTPFDKERLRTAAYDEIRRIIREEEPARPSRRISTLGETLTVVSAQRKTDARRLGQLFRGELDWIVMKALEKDRNRRYETASAFAADVQRYLRDEAVHACPPSASYRLRKFVRRNKMPAFAAAFILLTLVAGVAGVTWKWLEADYQKGLAQQKTRDEETAKEQAQQLSKDLQKNLYEQAIALAHHEWQNGNPGRAEQLLDDCRPEYRGWEWHYLHRLCHSDRLTLAAHADPLHCVAYSPDGRLIAAGSGLYEKDKPVDVIVWDAATGKELFTLPGHRRLVRSVAFSPNGKLLASAGLDPAVRIWDVATRRQTACYPGRGGWITCVTFSPNNSLLAAADNKWLRVWNVAAGKEVLTISNVGMINAIAFSPDGLQIAGACKQPRQVRLWDARSGAEVRIFEGHDSDVASVVFSPDGRRLASASWDTKIKVWDVAGGKELFTIHRHSSVVPQVCFSPDGKFLASASWDGTVRLWECAKGAEVRTFRGHTGLINSVAFSPDGEHLASAGSDRQVRVWDVMTEQEGRRLSLPSGHPYGLAFSADGKLLAAADGNIYYGMHKNVAIYDTRTGLLVRSLAGHTGRVTGVAFRPQREPGSPLLASSSTDHTVKLWNPATGQVVHTLRGHAGDVTGVAFSLDGRRLASASADRTVRVWDASTGQECRLLRGHTGDVSSVAFAPDGRLASASADGTVRVWNTADDAPCLILKGHSDAVTGVAFNPDGRHLASASADQTLRIWDAASGREVFVLRGHTEPVLSLAHNPRGDRIVSASQFDHTVRLWDARTGRQLLALRQNQVISVAFSPDGRSFASGAAHKEFIEIWDAAPLQSDDPAQLMAWFKYYAGQKQWDKAAAALARVDRQLPGDANLLPAAGRVYFDGGAWDQAADCNARALQHGQTANLWGLHYNIGLCRSRQRRWQEAIARLNDAIKQGPPDKRPWRVRAECYDALREWRLAGADYSECLQQWSTDPTLWRGRGHCRAELGMWSAAAADFAEANRLQPDDAATWDRCAVAYLGAKDLDGYRRTCAGMLERFGKPEKRGLASWAIWIATFIPDAGAEWQPLVKLEEQLVVTAPKNWNLVLTLGWSHCRAGQHKEAVARLSDSCAVHPKGGNAHAWLGLALAHHHLGHGDAALHWLEKASAWIERASHEDVKDGRTPTPLGWNDRIILGLLRREAEALIGGRDEKKNKSPKDSEKKSNSEKTHK
jgi:WD40 repeat protein/Flp pilus assembly protein TadD